MYARMPAPRIVPVRSSPPAGTVKGCQFETSSPSSLTAAAAPVTATTVSVSKRSFGPERVISSPAAPLALPTRRLATRKA